MKNGKSCAIDKPRATRQNKNQHEIHDYRDSNPGNGIETLIPTNKFGELNCKKFHIICNKAAQLSKGSRLTDAEKKFDTKEQI